MNGFIRVKRHFFLLIMVGALIISFMGGKIEWVSAKETSDGEFPPPEVEVVNPYYTIERFTLVDGTMLEKNIINGPPDPLPEYEEARAASIQPLPSRGVIADFPSYDWVFGCSAVSGAMIAGYYDRNGYANMYSGLTNGGVMPLSDTSWTTWSDGYDTYPNNPLIASHNGVDGRTTKGSIDDYWVRYDSTANDPYITGGWPQHSWSDAVGDYMKTSQSVYGNVDGSTTFYNWTNLSDPMTCSDMEMYEIDDEDGTYGRKLFYEARGYSVGDCYNQKTDNNGGGFSLNDFQTEIDAGHPVLLNLAGHSIVGFGYTGSTIYIRDTWDNNPSNAYNMTWGGSYEGMTLLSVSVVRLNPLTPPPSPPTGVSASDGAYPDRVRISWSASVGADHYKVFRNTTDSTTSATELISGHLATPYDDLSATPGETYFYWVKACNSGGCSNFSTYNTGYAELSPPSAPTGVSASDGTFPSIIRVSWNPSPGATYYKVFRNTSTSHTGEIELISSHPSSPYNDMDTNPDTIYTYWVKACNPADCSDYSNYDTGWRTSVPTESNLFLPLILNAYGNPSSPLINGDFEQGHVGWIENSSSGEDLIFEVVSGAHSGSWIAWLGYYDYENDELFQTVTISAAQPYLHFWYIIDSEDFCGYDHAYIVVDGDYVAYAELCYDNNSEGWVHASIDLTGYTNRTVTLMFEVTTDISLSSNFFLDTISLSSNSSTAAKNHDFLIGEVSEVFSQEKPDK